MRWWCTFSYGFVCHWCVYNRWTLPDTHTAFNLADLLSFHSAHADSKLARFFSTPTNLLQPAEVNQENISLSFNASDILKTPKIIQKPVEDIVKYDYSESQLPLFSSKSEIETENEPNEIVVQMSALNEDLKAKCMQQLRSLGIRFIDSSKWNQDCTHLIAGYPTRSEKYLAACAAGKLVLKPSWIEECSASERIVPASSHRWQPDGSVSDQHKSLAAACTRWIESEKNAFTNWKCALFSDSSKKEGFQRLLEAGGAEVSVNPATVESNITHVFREKDSGDCDFSGSVNIYSTDCIANYLIHDELEPKETNRKRLRKR